MKQLAKDTGRGVARPWAWLRRPIWIVVVAFTLRLAVIGTLLAHNQVSWKANEPSGIAGAIVQGQGFSSAFHDASGPTAWLAPVYPTLLACIFRSYGIKTVASAVVAILLNVILASLTAAVLGQLGREQFSETS